MSYGLVWGMSGRGSKFLGLFSTLFFACLLAFSGPALAADAPRVVSVDVSGNEHIAAQYILGVVETRMGAELNRDTLQKDIEAIYSQGFFSYVDVDLRPEGEGVSVTYSVRENPVIESISFSGNTIYTSEVLMKEVFSQVGTVFNRVFFRNDLDRIQDRYHKGESPRQCIFGHWIRFL